MGLGISLFATTSLGRGISSYLLCGLALHASLGVVELFRTSFLPRPWPDVEVDEKRLSEGGTKAQTGEGREVYAYDTPWNAYSLFKLCFATATGLLPVRLFIFGACFASNVLALTLAPFLPKASLPRRLCEKVFYYGCKGLSMSCACYAIDVYGADRIRWPGRPGPHPIIVPNHISLVEVFNMHWLTGAMSGVMAKSQLNIPGMSACVDSLDLVIIDPKDPANKENVKAKMRKFAHNEPEGSKFPFSRAFVIYPEGVTSAQHALWRFNLGAFEPGVTVLPVVQRFPYSFYNPGWVSPSRLNAGNDLPMMLLWYMSQFVMPTQVKFLPPWEPSEAEKKDPAVFANNMQNYMAIQLGWKVTSTSYKIIREKGGVFDLKSKGPAKGD
mmetsp:Transcript_57325/g.136255  ORF Transcript_57325/g.136255 Transcript_57325/m.136255 type:complete len:384 (-) Transcript_57325:236-1387(-)